MFVYIFLNMNYKVFGHSLCLLCGSMLVMGLVHMLINGDSLDFTFQLCLYIAAAVSSLFK